jgi:hypothetical protein
LLLTNCATIMNQRGYLPGTNLPPGLHGGGRLGFSAQMIDRRKQINTLLIFNEHVLEVRHDVEYRIPFQAGSQLNLTMIVVLPPEFPGQARPVIKLYAAHQVSQEWVVDANIMLTHPWLNRDHVVVGSPGLNTYGRHSDLGRVVQAIKREFELHPPTMAATTAKISGPQNCDSASGQQQHRQIVIPSSSAVTANSFNGGESQSRPSSQRTLPQLERLSEEELKELHDDPVALRLFCHTLDDPTFSELDQRSASLRNSIDSTMKANQGLCSKLHKKQETMAAKRADVHKLQAQVRTTALHFNEMKVTTAPASICDHLKKTSQQDEADSERCAERFLSGHMQLDDFLSTYVSVRTNHHLRKSKAEKIENHYLSSTTRRAGVPF